MDENTAWNRFAASGRVEDYLIYKQAKACAPQTFSDIHTEAVNENQNRGSDTDGTNYQRER